MRNPKCRQAQDLAENIVGQRAAEVRQDGRLFARGLRHGRRRPADPGMIRIQARRVHHAAVRLGHCHHVEALPLQMAAQGQDDVVRVGADHEAKLAAGRRAGGMAFTGFSGLPEVKARISKLFHAITRSIGVRLSSPQFGSISGASSPPSTSTPASAMRMEFVGGRPPLRHADLAPVRDAGERVGQHDRRVDDQPAPIARVMPAITEVDDHVEGVGPARPHKERGQIRPGAGTVGAAQHIRRQRSFCWRANSWRPGSRSPPRSR